MFKSGFVSIIGRPNVGKSTLLNALVGVKLAIVADKPQTTRTSVQGVWSTDEGQVIFLDTPGIHKSDTAFNKRMMSTVRAALDERDLLLFLIDVSAEFEQEDAHALDSIGKIETPSFLVLNKIDRLSDKAQLLPIIEKYKSIHPFQDFYPISAIRQEGLDELRKGILERMPEGPEYFPGDYLTDQPERFMASELIREKILHATRQEVPHSIAVVIDEFKEKTTLTKISATIFVEREGQKAIVIGSQGAMLKKVGTLARKELEKLLDRKIFLELTVKVQTNWRENPEFLDSLDWRSMMGSDATGDEVEE